MKSMDQDAIVQHISKRLYNIEHADFELLKCIGLIAHRVLKGRKKLKRSTDAEELTGMVIAATWDIAKATARTDIIAVIEDSIKRNKVLKDEDPDALP